LQFDISTNHVTREGALLFSPYITWQLL